MKRFFVVLCLVFLAAGTVHAQVAEELKAKRQRLQKELRKTNQRLAATRKQRGAAVGQASLLRQQIEQRTELLETLHAEAARNAARLHRDSNVVVSLTDDLERMGTEYGRKVLLAKVRKQQQQGERLNREIRAAISRAIARDERKTKADRKAGVVASKASIVGGAIDKQKGKLGWPIRGKIVRRFGTQPHPDVPSVKIQNSGIDIDAGPSETIEAIFAGEVISLRKIPGLHSIIMVRHGGFYTVYSNLEHPQVKMGDHVQAGQQLGLTTTNGDALHFEIWKGKVPLNPASWLVR